MELVQERERARRLDREIMGIDEAEPGLDSSVAIKHEAKFPMSAAPPLWSHDSDAAHLKPATKGPTMSRPQATQTETSRLTDTLDGVSPWKEAMLGHQYGGELEPGAQLDVVDRDNVYVGCRILSGVTVRSETNATFVDCVIGNDTQGNDLVRLETENGARFVGCRFIGSQGNGILGGGGAEFIDCTWVEGDYNDSVFSGEGYGGVRVWNGLFVQVSPFTPGYGLRLKGGQDRIVNTMHAMHGGADGGDKPLPSSPSDRLVLDHCTVIGRKPVIVGDTAGFVELRGCDLFSTDTANGYAYKSWKGKAPEGMHPELVDDKNGVISWPVVPAVFAGNRVFGRVVLHGEVLPLPSSFMQPALLDGVDINGHARTSGYGCGGGWGEFVEGLLS